MFGHRCIQMCKATFRKGKGLDQYLHDILRKSQGEKPPPSVLMLTWPFSTDAYIVPKSRDPTTIRLLRLYNEQCFRTGGTQRSFARWCPSKQLSRHSFWRACSELCIMENQYRRTHGYATDVRCYELLVKEAVSPISLYTGKFTFEAPRKTGSLGYFSSKNCGCVLRHGASFPLNSQSTTLCSRL